MFTPSKVNQRHLMYDENIYDSSISKRFIIAPQSRFKNSTYESADNKIVRYGQSYTYNGSYILHVLRCDV